MVNPSDTDPALRELIGRGAAHGAQSDNHDVRMLHDARVQLWS